MGSLGVESVVCKGCDKSRLQQVAVKSKCTMENGKFECASAGHCELGTPAQDCTMTPYACHIYPCSACADETLKAKCCESCLVQMCGEAAPIVTLCQGCEAPPNAGSLIPGVSAQFFR